jgi:uncharacterized membrane protein
MSIDSDAGSTAGPPPEPAATGSVDALSATAVAEPETDATNGADAVDSVDEEEAPERDVFDHWIFGDDPVWGVLGIGVTALAMLWYFLHFGHLTTDIHNGYGDSAFDVGLYDQGVWLLSRFHAPFVTMMGRDLFGDHTQFSLLALVPLYWIHSGADTLYYVQALMMCLGAVPVYMLVMRRMNNPLFATVLAVCFLLHPALAQTNLENYHPDSFLIPIMGFLLYAAIENKPRMLITFSVLALLCKEDVVLILLPVLIWYAWRKNWKLGLTLAAGSVFAAFFMTYVVMRSFIGVPTLNTWRIPTFDECKNGCAGLVGQVGALVHHTVKKPADVVKYVIKGDSPNGRPFYVWQMIAPTGLMFLIAPELALTTILVLGMNVISTFGYQHQIAYHYSMVILPGLAMGTAWAISKLKTTKWRAVAVSIVAVSTLWSAFLWGPFPFSVHNNIAHWSPSYPPVAAINQVAKQLPPNAPVSAYYSFTTHIDHRKEIYMWPTPFHAVDWNTFKQEGDCLPLADHVQYLMLPPDLSDHDDVFKSIKSQFDIVAQSSNAVLYKRVANPPPGSICNQVRAAGASS